jgi:hypothetical protein
MRVKSSVAYLAKGQHGVVTRRQLLDAGVSRSGIERRIEAGMLHVAHRGVYRVGHMAPSFEARCMAAVLACGSGALLSHYGAAHLHRLIKRLPARIDVLTRSDRKVKSIHTHRSTHLHATKVRGIPVTTVPRTIVDLAAELDPSSLARLFHEATVLRGTTPAQVERVLADLPNAHGATALRRVLHGDTHITQRPGIPLPLPACLFVIPPPGNQPQDGRPLRRLPVAGTPPHRRTRQLPRPLLPSRVGARSPSRTRGLRPRG